MRSPPRFLAASITLYVCAAGAGLVAWTWEAHSRSSRRWDPVRTRAITDREFDGAGWLLIAVIVVSTLLVVALVWRRAHLVDASGLTIRTLRSRRRIAWTEVTAARAFTVRNRPMIAVSSASEALVVRLPDTRRAERIAAVQRALDLAGRGVQVEIPRAHDDDPVAIRRAVHDLEVALGRRSPDDPRPQWTERDKRRAMVLVPVLLLVMIGTVAFGLWFGNTRAERLDEAREPPPTLDLGALSGLLDPDLSTIDADARAVAERALATLVGAASSIDCDGRVPTEGGLAGVRYVSVRTAAGLWEATPAVAPPTDSTTWRLSDLEDSGVFATTGPLPAPSARWEIKVNTYLGPAWFGCKPVDRPVP